MGIDIQRIEFLDRQKEMSDSYEYHGIRLDIYLKDEKIFIFSLIPVGVRLFSYLEGGDNA